MAELSLKHGLTYKKNLEDRSYKNDNPMPDGAVARFFRNLKDAVGTGVANAGEVRREAVSREMHSGRHRLTRRERSAFGGILPPEERHLNQGMVDAVSETVEVAKNVAGNVQTFARENSDGLMRAGQAGMVGLAVMGSADKLAQGVFNTAPNPAHVRTEVHPGLTEYIAANPLPSTSYAPEVKKVVEQPAVLEAPKVEIEKQMVQTPDTKVTTDPFDVNGIPAVDAANLPSFNSQRPDFSTAITAQEQVLAGQMPTVNPGFESDLPKVENTYVGSTTTESIPEIVEPAVPSVVVPQRVEPLPDIVEPNIPSVTTPQENRSSAPAAEYLPDVVEPQPESIYSSQNSNSSSFTQEIADAVTEAEKILAANQPIEWKDAKVAEPSVATAHETHMSESQIKIKDQIVSELLQNLPQEHKDILNGEINEWMGPSEKNYLPVLPQLIKDYDAMITAASTQYGIPKFMFYAHMLVESNGIVAAQSDKSDAVGLFQFRPPAAREVGLRVDPDNGIDERLNPEKAIIAFAKYFNRNKNFLGGGLSFGMQGFKAGMGNERHYIMLADSQRRSEWGAAARDTNAFSVMQNPAVRDAIQKHGDPDDFVYPAKILTAAILYNTFILQAR